MVFFLISGCSKSSDNNSFTLGFPANDYEKTEFNANIYEIEPFSVSFSLPEGWSVEEETPENRNEFPVPYFAWSRYGIRNESGEYIGGAGYNIYELYEGASEDDLHMIYNQLALGSGYRFDVDESYRAVKETGKGTTGVMDVCYSDTFYSTMVNDGEECKNNWGILSNNKEKLVYVAFELDSNKVTEEQVTEIAESIAFQ